MNNNVGDVSFTDLVPVPHSLKIKRGTGILYSFTNHSGNKKGLKNSPQKYTHILYTLFGKLSET